MSKLGKPQRLRQKSYSFVMFSLLTVLFFLLMAGVVPFLRKVQFDFTDRQLFSISSTTQRVLANLPEPVTLHFFFSQKASTSVPRLRIYGEQVHDLLEDMVALSKGKLRIIFVDPSQEPRETVRAQTYGLKGLPSPDGGVFYLGLVGTNPEGKVESMPFLLPARGQYLEYDIVRMVTALYPVKKITVGLISNLPLDTGSGGIGAAQQNMAQPFGIYEQLIRHFDVRFLQPALTQVPEDIDVLVVAHPRPMARPTLYALEQFIMRGGGMLAFVDPHSEVSLKPSLDGEPLQGSTPASDLNGLLTNWGISFDLETIVADRTLARPVKVGSGSEAPVADYVLWLGLGEKYINGADPVLAGLDLLVLGTAGFFSWDSAKAANVGVQITPLLETSENSMLLERSLVYEDASPARLLRAFTPTTQQYTLALRVGGRPVSAFAPPPVAAAKPQDSTAAKPARHLAKAQKDIRVILLADSDIFDDSFWLRRHSVLENSYMLPIADNGKFVLNAIENLAGLPGLMELRGREKGDHSLTTMKKIRRDMERRYESREKVLTRDIAQYGQQLSKLRAMDPFPADAEFTTRTNLVAARKMLRDLQTNFRHDLIQLEAMLELVTTLSIPLVIVIVMMINQARRFWRRRQRVR